ncbi:MAG: lysophospholipase [Oenococcus sp.]|uniref:lysophospholipase n=1 Tax=Oenococcus sp. TaxID=1979414 RepID=UPI0039EC33C2
MINFPLTIESHAFLGSWIEDPDHQHILTTNLGAELYLKSHECSQIVLDWAAKTRDGQCSRILISLDGGVFKSEKLTADPIILSLDPKEDHLIRIMTQAISYEKARTWTLTDYFCLQGVTHNGQLTGAVPNRKKLIFVGDSIINGQKILADKTTAAHRPDLSWDFLVSEALNLNNVRIAYGGCGITQHAKIYPPTAMDFLWLLSETLPRPIDQRDDIAGVVVNLGTNDGDADQQEFTFALKMFLRELKKRFHDAKIIIVEPFNGNFKQVFESVVTSYDPNYTLIKNTSWQFPTSDGGVHLNQLGHQQAADILLPKIKEAINA